MKAKTKQAKPPTADETLAHVNARLAQLEAFVARLEAQRVPSRPAPRPAATLHLDTLSIRHIRCEEFILEDKDTGEARLEIRSNNGEVSIKLWPPQEAGHRSAVIIAADQEGGRVEVQSLDGQQSSLLSISGICNVSAKGGK